jgi:uncharacterized RDD family membrane protein YckC
MSGAARSAGQLRLRTPEGVTFTLRLASPVLRLVAHLIDWMVVAAAWGLATTGLSLLKVVSADLFGAVSIVGYFVLSQGYRIYGEYRWRGQPLGKRVMKLRVIDGRGLRLTLAQVVLRNVLRFLDVLPAAYAVGGIAALLNRRGQRLGDLVADTLVIWEPAELVPDLGLLPVVRYNSLREHLPAVARLRQAVAPLEARVAWQALRRRDRLDDRARLELFAQLAEHFRAVAALPPDVLEGVSDEQVVRNVVDVLFASAPKLAATAPG